MLATQPGAGRRPLWPSSKDRRDSPATKARPCRARCPRSAVARCQAASPRAPASTARVPSTLAMPRRVALAAGARPPHEAQIRDPEKCSRLTSSPCVSCVALQCGDLLISAPRQLDLAARGRTGLLLEGVQHINGRAEGRGVKHPKGAVFITDAYFAGTGSARGDRPPVLRIAPHLHHTRACARAG